MIREVRRCIVRGDSPWQGMEGYAWVTPNPISGCVGFQSLTGTYPRQANILQSKIEYISDKIELKQF